MVHKVIDHKGTIITVERDQRAAMQEASNIAAILSVIAWATVERGGAKWTITNAGGKVIETITIAPMSFFDWFRAFKRVVIGMLS